MASKPERRGLGRGLSALMAEANLAPQLEKAEPSGDGDRRALPIEKIIPNPEQPRRHFTEEALKELSASIRARGVLQPLIVRPHPQKKGFFELVAGERRWRASQLAKLHEVPVIIRDFTDEEVMEVAIVENIQRADLNAIEEAAAYRQLMDRFGHTQDQLAQSLHKSRTYVTNHIRLLNLPEPVQDYVRDGKLTAGHARALITASNSIDLAKRVIERGLSVRETEALVKKLQKPNEKPKGKAEKTPTGKDADTRALEGDLTAHLKMQVSIDVSSSNRGKLTINYTDLDQLDQLIKVLSGW